MEHIMKTTCKNAHKHYLIKANAGCDTPSCDCQSTRASYKLGLFSVWSSTKFHRSLWILKRTLHNFCNGISAFDICCCQLQPSWCTRLAPYTPANGLLIIRFHVVRMIDCFAPGNMQCAICTCCLDYWFSREWRLRLSRYTEIMAVFF